MVDGERTLNLPDLPGFQTAIETTVIAISPGNRVKLYFKIA